MKKYAGVLLVAKDGEIILQQRDDKPKIVNPGMITFFGGTVEINESPAKAAIRELDEELGITLSLQSIEKLGVLKKEFGIDGESVECHIFIAKDIELENVNQKEGRGIFYFKSINDLNNPKLSRITKEALQNYLKST